MKKAITIASLLMATSALADPKIFNMELGKTTEKEFRTLYNAQKTGINKYTDGSMYELNNSEIEFESLQKVTTIFDSDEVLVAVLTTFPKSKFDYLNKILSQKYKNVSQEIPFVGNKSATFRDGETEITLSAPHMSFEMSMNYIRDDLKREYEKQLKAESGQKKKNEASQL
ncbi:hypothetical protein ACYCFC_15785 [Stutzerimonas sp. NM35]